MLQDFSTVYYDDFNEDKKFYRILYRPGYAVQARELTQMQTIIQNQITKFGNHVFKEGAMVIPGEISVDMNAGYVKLDSSYNSVLADTVLASYVGKVITNGAGTVEDPGLRALVVSYSKGEGSDPPTLFVRYKNSGTNGTDKVYSGGDVLKVEDDINISYVRAISTNPVGLGSLATVKKGVYYIKGNFVVVDEQTIILDKYDTYGSYRVGLVVSETIITPEDDTSLFDNAQNTFNYAAPGAHRYYIDAILTKIALDSIEDTDFVELVRLQEGKVKRMVSRTDYSILEETMARRTYDESGNYTVREFPIDVREYRNNNRGAWTSGRYYLVGDVVTNASKTYVAKNSGQASSTAPVHTSGTTSDGGVDWEYNEVPFYNRGIFLPANTADEAANKAMESKLAIGLEKGKAYVQGYEIEKIATEYLTVDKARTSVQIDNGVIQASVGNYVFITNINSLPPVDSFSTVSLYNYRNATVGVIPSGGTVVGTARVRFIEWANGSGSTAIYKLGLFDIQMLNGNDFNQTVKSLFFDRSNTHKNFTADIQPELTRLSGSITSYTASSYNSAGSGTYILGNGTSFQDELKVNDVILVSGSYRRVTSIDAQNKLQVDSSINISGLAYDRVLAQVYEPDNVSLIFPIQQYAVKSVRSSTLTNDTSYTVYEKLDGTATTSGSPTLTVITSSGTMASGSGLSNYIVIDNSDGAGGVVVTPLTTIVSGDSVVFGLDAAYSGHAMSVIATVKKSGATLTEKTKTRQTATVTFTTQATAQNSILMLGHADGYRLISVKMKSGTWASPGATYSNDISDRYYFDDGQRDTHYDIARLSLKNSYAPPEAPIEVVFEYFTHSPGDYFTADSYPQNLITYAGIPQYLGFPLRNAIDFRPRMADRTTVSGGDFTGTGSSKSLVPRRGVDITADYSYYLARKAKIAVDFNGTFFNIDGIPSLSPAEPQDPSLGMVLYNLTLEPYTFGTSNNSVVVHKVDNKRYTMRDIGKLEKRIDNLEYYTSLSMLEQQTESLKITDANGLDRFKNGFIVDSFKGHNVGDVANPDYFCSIDMEKGELRPFYSMQNIGMIEKNDLDSQRSTSKYKLYGDVITLPVLEDTPIITQQFASRLQNINPFAVFTFLGDIKLNPATDDWFDVDRRPDLVIDVEGTFTTVKLLAEKAGVLGTVWNAWQTQWTGQSVTRTFQFSNAQGTANATFTGLGPAVNVTNGSLTSSVNIGVINGFASRFTTAQVTATTVGQARTGIKTSVVQQIDRQVVGDKVLSSAIIPYMRSRNVLIQVRKLKPKTKFYPFFDQIGISAYCTPASKMIYTPLTGSFDSELNVGGQAIEVARRINGDAQMCLNMGDVITGQTSGATAVVVGKEHDIDAGTYSLYILNIIGTFSPNETIKGSVTTATGTMVSLSIKSQGDDVYTNFSGDAQLLFNIPNNEQMRFRCGSREFKLVDVATADGEFSSRARTNYDAYGILETRQRTINAVRNGLIVSEQMTETQTIVQTSSRVLTDSVTWPDPPQSGWFDPLAQSFMIDVRGGCFLSKVDIFFATKDPTIPVTLEIRECVNGFPGPKVLPFSRVVLSPSQVNLSTNTVDLDGVTVNSYDTATTFKFSSPVYVEQGGEYALVLSSDSNGYQVWVSQTKDLIPGTSRYISSQPYLGSLFKSQNASTWTADQDQDMKFTIYRCKFDTTATSSLEYINSAIPLQTLEKDPFEIRAGSTTVRVWQSNHGMTEAVSAVGGSKVTISGVAGTINGIPASELNGSHVVSNVDLDSYTITVTTTPTSSGYAGGSDIRATRNIQFDAVQPNVTMQTFPETTASFKLKTISGKSVDSGNAQIAYVDDGTTAGVPVLANENNYFSKTRMVASEENEVYSNDGDDSLVFSIQMKTTNDAVSPIIDNHRTSMILIANKIDNPTQDNVNVPNLDYNTIVSANANISFSGYTLNSSNSTTKTALATLTVGKYVAISGAANANNNGVFLVTAVASDGASVTFDHAFTTESTGSSITLVQREAFVAEIAPSLSRTTSKYVTKLINLANPSNYIRVRFAINLPPDADVEVWYKTNAVGSTVPIETVPYTQLTVDETIKHATNETEQFYDATYSKDNVATFDAIQVKLVMKSTNSAQVPRIRDFRVIACA